MKIIKLYFESPVHFGEKRLSESKITFSADTLFSALMIEAVGLGKEDEFYQLASNNLVKFSDAFPFIDQYYYIPKPMFNLKLEKEDENLSKAFKKLLYGIERPALFTSTSTWPKSFRMSFASLSFAARSVMSQE